MRAIVDKWDSYFRKIIAPVNPSSVQIKESKRAFYAGAQGALSIMTEIGEMSISEDDGAQMFQDLIDECDMFAIGVMKGEN